MTVFLQRDLFSVDFLASIEAELARRKWRVIAFRPDETAIAGLPIGGGVFICGALWVKLQILKRLGLTGRILPDYPTELRHLLHRTIWEGSLEELLRGPARAQQPVFVKVRMSGRINSDAFASQLVESIDVVAAAPMVHARTLLACSEPVEWIAEWRVYVCRGKIQDVFLYSPRLETLADVKPEMVIDFD
ncbi:MAG: ATP-grasp domain-containing protein, partial [Acidobacteriota bacterium]|nr:ATP-grasp domain-containing protein [Acidobacteriota bacterium]